MTDSNRVRVAAIKEVTPGTTPASPRFRTVRLTGESLSWQPGFFTPNEIRADRMSADPTKINEKSDGGINFEWSYPAANSAKAAMLESAMLSTWSNTPERDNDGVADAVITDLGTVANTAAFLTGAAFVIGHLVQTSGFAEAANNTVVKVTTGGATSLVATGSGWTAQAVPPAAARIKVVGIEGASGDITATATGLASTTMNFVNMGIVAGMWLNIGGTAAGTKYSGVAANNAWVRATVVSANAITLDNRPVGWGVDAGAGKTIRVWFGDYIRNGTSLLTLTLERAFLDQAVPTFVRQTGMAVDRLSVDMTTEQAITGSFGFMGMSGSQGTSILASATYAAATTGLVMTSNVSIGSILLSGTALGSPNWVRSLTIDVSNNLRQITANGAVGAVALGTGEIGVTGKLETYFGDNTLLAAQFAGQVGSIVARSAANSQAIIWTLPRVTFGEGSPNAGGKNQDVTLPLSFVTSIDTVVTNAEIDLQRIEYFEA